MMSGIRGKNTKPELLIRRALHSRGFRYRIHVKNFPGRPDLLFPARRAVIFVHGCFWHGHDCALFRLPGTRQEFWSEKIGRNQQRDNVVRAQIEELDWRQLTIWECAFRGPGQIGLDETIERAILWLESGARCKEIRSVREEELA